MAATWLGCKIKATTQGESHEQDTSGTLANLAFKGLQPRYLPFAKPIRAAPDSVPKSPMGADSGRGWNH